MDKHSKNKLKSQSWLVGDLAVNTSYSLQTTLNCSGLASSALRLNLWFPRFVHMAAGCVGALWGSCNVQWCVVMLASYRIDLYSPARQENQQWASLVFLCSSSVFRSGAGLGCCFSVAAGEALTECLWCVRCVWLFSLLLRDVVST